MNDSDVDPYETCLREGLRINVFGFCADPIDVGVVVVDSAGDIFEYQDIPDPLNCDHVVTKHARAVFVVMKRHAVGVGVEREAAWHCQAFFHYRGLPRSRSQVVLERHLLGLLRMPSVFHAFARLDEFEDEFNSDDDQ